MAAKYYNSLDTNFSAVPCSSMDGISFFRISFQCLFLAQKKTSGQKSILKPNWDQISLNTTWSNVSSIFFKKIKKIDLRPDKTRQTTNQIL